MFLILFKELGINVSCPLPHPVRTVTSITSDSSFLTTSRFPLESHGGSSFLTILPWLQFEAQYGWYYWIVNKLLCIGHVIN